MGGTEGVRSLEITNCSLLLTKYHWSLCWDSQADKLGYVHLCPLLEALLPGALLVLPQTPGPPHLPRELAGITSSVDAPPSPLEAEKAFSILPLSGVLQPGESQQVSFTFSGCCNILPSMKALCCVEGGPTYEVELITSRLSYSLSCWEINCGPQIFNEISHSTVTLENTGRTEFTWVLKPSTAAKHLPGVFLVDPTTGFIAPGEKQELEFSYMPGIPGAFIRIYQLEVDDLDPKNITLKGEACCPMISMNLPWNTTENEKYEKLLKESVKHLQQYSERNKSKVVQKTQSLKSQTLKTQTPKTQTSETRDPKTQDLKPRLLSSGMVPNTQLQINMMRMLIKKAALERQKRLTYHLPKGRFPNKQLRQSLVKVKLPEYILDMGPVLKGFTEKSTLEITNPGQIPVSFQADLSALQDTGFSVDLGLIKSLPPSHTVAFEVHFESAHQPPGDVDVLLPVEVPQLLGQAAGWAQQQMSPAPSAEFSVLLQVTNGPTFHIHLCATVLGPSLELSKNTLQFSDIPVGQCQVETIRLYNRFQAPCKWSIKSVLKRSYKNELKLNICGSSNHLKLHLSGQGLEPRLEFSPPALKMGWVLVDSNGLEATAVVKNPCSFPIEFYSLDFDEQYLEEEKILRMALGSENKKSFLMPPRAMGGTLLPKVLEDYEAQKRLKAQQAELKTMAEAKARAESEAEDKGKAAPGYHRVVMSYSEPMVKATGNPVSLADLCHLCIAQKTNKPQEKVEKKPEQNCGGQRSHQSFQLEAQSEIAEGAVRDCRDRTLCLDMLVTDPRAMMGEILREDQMLEHLGLHPDGPPLPPAAVLSIVEYPEERLGPAGRVEPFTLLAPQEAEAPDMRGSSAEGQPKMGEAASRDSSAKESQMSTQRTKSPQDSPTASSKSTLESASMPTEFLRPKRYRWVVPAHGEVELKVHFSTKKPGKFEQTLRFELVQTKRQYELPCRGTSLYPSISQDPRLVFPQWRKTMKEDEIIFKEYVESTEQFHFGPLMCGKSREWYKCQNCPSNSEKITILNNSPMNIEVQFSFENAGEAETFLLDPPSMALKPKEKQELTIWAYPTSPGFLQGKLICSIGKNPEPVIFSLCCLGVRMKLEVSPLELSFDKQFLHSTDSRTLVLRNNTLLPMAWQLSGLDDVKDFSLSQDNGVIGPRSEFEVTVHFRAGQMGSIEETLQLEVSDPENILGIVQAENIKISAEVYDISLSIDMSEGPDGSLEFGTINVLDNAKHVLTLQNKGAYNIEYSFMLKDAGPRMQDLASHFTVEPKSGVLTASQPGVDVEMIFHPTREILLKNKPILYCQVRDASSGEGSELVGNIPLRVSAKAEYSKCSVEPASPINFGAMVKGTRKTLMVVLENKGTLNFKFCIRQAPEEASALESKRSGKAFLSEEEGQPQPQRKAGELSMTDIFAFSPQFKARGICSISYRALNRKEIKLLNTALVEDVTSIFEDYPICSSTNLGQKLQSVKGTGLFVTDENRFIFSNIQVGQEAEAHFSIYNARHLPCDVVLSIKPLSGEEKSPIKNIFKLYPVKMSIPGSSYAIATVTFTPPEEQNYNCTFKASLVIPKGSVGIEPQILTFTISGKGHKPRLTVVCPSARSKRGNAMLCFKRLQLWDSEVLPLVIHNNGIIPVKFMLLLEDEHGMFFLKGRASPVKVFHTGDVEKEFIGKVSKLPKKPLFLLSPGQSAEFDVIFKPTLAQHLEGKIYVLVKDSYSKETLIELVGEGHKDEFTLLGLEDDTQERNVKSSLKKDVIDAVRVNHIEFGDCPVGKRCYRTFAITNRSLKQFMRFEWEADAPFLFSPKVGHLHPGCAKDITVILKSDVPATFRRHLVKCKMTKVNFELPQKKVPDWDDQMCIVTWKDTTRKDLAAAKWPKIKQVVKTAPEPAHTVVEESSQEFEVYLSAVVAYTQFKLSTTMIQFKNTLPFQTGTATFTLQNTGEVALKYSWEKPAESEPVKKPYSTTLMRKSSCIGRFLSYDTVKHRRKLLRLFWSEQDQPLETHPKVQQLQWPAEQQQDSEQELDSNQDSEQDSEQELDSELDLNFEQELDFEQQQYSEQEDCVSTSLEVFPDVVHDLFSINPYHGIIAPGQEETFDVQFFPKCMGEFKTTLLCRWEISPCLPTHATDGYH
ncbi:Hydrocephalus-inducing [Lonchura striata]|uniref:Hydrocephalus-inducing n=1 Tax=Lonchura striata TaxID=40157 RepID=A0A218U7M7_9PASE|nr:Hydrocephalus-inducing [Lonchura striata domestica]